MPAFVVRPFAEADVQAAFDWYEAQAHGLGHEFLRAVDVCYATIERWPEAYPIVYRGVRRALLRRFPYLVYYRAASTENRDHRVRARETAPTPVAAQALMPNKWMKATAACGGCSLSIGR